MSELRRFVESGRPAPRRLGALTALKWQAFKQLARLAQRRSGAAPTMTLDGDSGRQPALWVFASTIGELNAIDAYVGHLLAQAPTLKLVLISDHALYRASFAVRHPQAAVCISQGDVDDAQRLALRYPPRLLVVAEIPCRPYEAPCRFSFGFVFAAKAAGALVGLVNGWLYRDPPSCRLDALERWLFDRDYLRAFDALGVQTSEIRTELLNAGAPADRLETTGNLKFDAMGRADWRPEGARSAALLQHLLGQGRPIVVAGCVTSFEEQNLVLDAFALLRQQLPAALLVIAPRHPELLERMQQLDQFIGQRGLSSQYKTRLQDDRIDADLNCLVIDLVGELRDFYAIATVAHVGVNHNALEPLAFAKPVTVCPGWLPGYASFPVYRLLMQQRCLNEAASAQELAQAWQRHIESAHDGRQVMADIQAKLEGCRGATQRNANLLERGLRASSAQVLQ